ncbi:MAG: Xaa-Pro dipeptidase [Wenzhouxiangella sp.]|nr:MAG: Xaa-Pro dipeptidase [Wenzhouxiangella sp.]
MLTSDDLLYARHIEDRRDQIDAALNELGYDALLIHSGRPKNRLFDDQHPPFRAHAPFVAIVPLPFAEDCLLEFQAGRKPRLWFCQPQDFWHLPPADPENWWAEHFQIEPVGSASDWEPRFRNRRALAAIGDPGVLDGLGDEVAINPPELLHRLAEARTRKTAWERECLAAANRRAAGGHVAAAAAFRRGASELEIQLEYLRAVGQDQDAQPYPGIVALNEHAAVLHYQNRSADPPSKCLSFLLDAGADHHGYASDITRTWTLPEHAEFAALVNAVDLQQQRLCESMRPGANFADLHRQAHLGIAEVVRVSGLVDMSPDDMVESGVSGYFLPHGLGHFLGAQVHDVNGLVAADGEVLPPPAQHPFLRLSRNLEPGNVVTVEPGLYFIPVLLDKLRRSEHGRRVRWERVEALRPFGGIRIEDNVLVSEGDPVNLTRQAFAALE